MKKVAGILLLSGLFLTGCGSNVTQAYLMENEWEYVYQQPDTFVNDASSVTTLADFDEDVVNLTIKLTGVGGESTTDSSDDSFNADTSIEYKEEMEYTLEGDQLTFTVDSESVTHEVRFDKDKNVLSKVVEKGKQEPIDEEVMLLKHVEPAEESSDKK